MTDSKTRPLDLCAICKRIFESPLVLREEVTHHKTIQGFVDAAPSCYICRTIATSTQWTELERRAKLCNTIPPSVWYMVPHPVEHKTDETSLVWYKITIDHPWDAYSLSPPPGSESGDVPDLYHETPVWEFRISSSRATIVGWSASLRLMLTDVELGSNIGDSHIPSDLDDPFMFELPKEWYRDCLEEHPLCRPPNPAFRPTRLLQIIDDNLTRLILTSDQEPKDSYAAFSHCWGKAKTLKLLQSNMAQLLAGIRVSELPTSYKEAIIVCRSMGFRYIWIDSLCIIQDSRQDWQQEAVTMKDVYQNSTLNLCASAAAENSEASFRHRDPTMIAPLKIVPEWTDGETHYITKFDMEKEELSYSPLRSRAWVVQEYYLSHRSLSLTKSQMWWQCRQRIACEAFPGGYPEGSIEPTRLKFMREGKEPQTLGGEERKHDYEWYRVVQDYCRCGLTVNTDKLIAFAGVAQAFKRFYPQDRYLAGFWSSQLPLALCWSTDNSSVTYRPDGYIAPTWSWASVKGVVTVPLIQDVYCFSDGEMLAPHQIHATVLDISLEHGDPQNETGQLLSGQLKLECHLIGPIDWRAPEDETFNIISGPASEVLYEITMGDARIVHDNTPIDEILHTTWWQQRAKKLSADAAEAGPDVVGDFDGPQNFPMPEYLVPIADFLDENGDRRTFGITVYCFDETEHLYSRNGNFERLVLPPGILESFPKRTIIIE